MNTNELLIENQLAIEQLIHRCIEGDNQAQKQFYEQYANKMFRVCYRYVRNEQDAEDLLINGFLKVFGHLKQMGSSRDEVAVLGNPRE